MKRQVVLALMAVLAVGVVAQAASSFDVTLGTLEAPDSVILGYDDFGAPLPGWWYSYSEAHAGNDTDYELVQNDPGAYVASPSSIAVASVIAANASATGSTGAESVSATASATTGPGSSAAYAYAEQLIWFWATVDGELEFEMEYLVNQTLSALGGESASADASVGLTLFRENGTQIGAEEWFYVFNDVSGVYNYSDGLEVSGMFSGNEFGYVRLRVDGNATATAAVIPAPGAILLGAMGAGLVGWLRRRRAL